MNLQLYYKQAENKSSLTSDVGGSLRRLRVELFLTDICINI